MSVEKNKSKTSNIFLTRPINGGSLQFVLKLPQISGCWKPKPVVRYFKRLPAIETSECCLNPRGTQFPAANLGASSKLHGLVKNTN